MARSRILPLFAVALFSLVNPAVASPPRYPDIMPLSQVKAGMRGYGLTVFRGTKIERFDVAIVGVVKKGSLAVPGHDMILVRMGGGPITNRKAYLIRGMSGSPVYINGKIIGAFSQGQPTTKEALGGVTPIEEMLEAWDPHLPEDVQTSLQRDRGVISIALAKPLRIGSQTIRKLVYNVPMSSGLRSHGDTLVMHPCTTFALFSGISESARQKLAKLLEPYNVELVKGAAAGNDPTFKGTPLVPGAAFAMMLATGDMSFGATGTITYRRGNRILGFGHQFMNIGPIDAPLASCYTYDVYPLSDGSYKISSFGPVMGVSAQDTLFSVSGYIGKTARTIPITVDVRDKTTGRSKLFHAQSVTHPNLFAGVVSAAVSTAVAEVRSHPGPAMATVTTTVDAEEIGKVSRTNICFDARGIDSAATADLDDFLGILTSNPFYPVGLKSATVKVEIETGRKTAQVERVFLKEGKFEPGETAQIGVVIKPYKQPSFTRIIPLKLPQNTPSGRYVLQVRGGAVPAGISFGGSMFRPGGPPSEQAPPASIRQMVARYEEKEKQNDVVVRLALLSSSLNVDGEKLTNLPPSLDALMRSSKSSAMKMDRDELRVVEPTDWVVSGQQLISFNVQRKDNQEGAAPGAGGIPNFQGGAGNPSFAQGSSNGPDSDAASSGLATVNDPDLTNRPIHSDDTLFVDDKKRDDKKKPVKADPKIGDKSAAKADPKTETKSEPAPQAATAATEEPKPAANSDQPTTEKPLGRQPQVWRQTSRTDFAKGESQGVAVTTGGDLVLTRRLKPFSSSTESFVWSLISDEKGGLFVGTGTQGAVLHVTPDGKSALLARLPEISVHGLALQSDGSLIAGTGPHGRIYRIMPDGKFALIHQTTEKYVLALVKSAQGHTYAATGGGSGRIYRISLDSPTKEIFKSPEDHVLCLAVDSKGVIYAGTSPNGIIYRVTPDGKASVLYDAPEASITGIGVNNKGDVYAVTAPHGVIYKIGQDGAAKVLFDKAPGPFTSLHIDGNNTVLAASGSAVYIVRPDNDTVAIADNKTDVDILALASDQRCVYAGTGNVAEIYCAASPAAGQARNEGTYTSVVHDAKLPSHWGIIRWTAATAKGTRISLRTRTGSVSEPDSSWSAWQSPITSGDGARIASPPGRYIQYQVTLEGEGVLSPTLRDVAITYLPRNQAPKVAFQAPAGGERWAGKQTLRWDASDPDKDTLSYEVYYSTDGGANWMTLPADGKATAPVAQVPKNAPTVSSNETLDGKVPVGSGPPSVASVKAELDKHPDLPPSMRDAILSRAMKINADFASLGGAGAPGASSQKENNRSINTKLLPDGVYQFRVVASDRISNPAEPLTAEAVSEPVLVCNTPPSVLLPKAAMVVENGSIHIEGSVVQARIAVTGVQFRVDNGDWMAAIPRDGIFDTGSESFILTSGKLAPGKHTVEVKAFNAAGLTVTEKVEVEVK